MKMGKSTYSERKGRKAKPLDAVRLRDMALRYVARYATSSSKLRNYLERKVRERGWQGDGTADIDALVGYCVDKGFVDDKLYASQKAGDLARKGYGRRRVDAMLFASGIDDENASLARESTDREKWRSALIYARRKAVGPFARKNEQAADRRHDKYSVASDDQKRRDRQISAMLRAGHDFDTVLLIVEAKDFVDLRGKGDQALDEALDGFDTSI